MTAKGTKGERISKLRLTAYHEAAHVVAAFRLRYADTPEYVTIGPDRKKRTLGHTSMGMSGPLSKEEIDGRIEDIIESRKQAKGKLEEEERAAALTGVPIHPFKKRVLLAQSLSPPSRKSALAAIRRQEEDKAMAALAGPVADMENGTDPFDGDGWRYFDLNTTDSEEALEVILERSSEGDDWHTARERLAALEEDDYLLKKRLLTLWKKTIRLVRKNWRDVERVADLLMGHTTLSRDMLFDVLAPEEAS